MTVEQIVHSVSQAMASETAKLVVSGAAGGLGHAGARLIQRLRGGPTEDVDALTRRIVAAAENDPEWAADIQALLEAADADRPRPWLGPLPREFRDRSEILSDRIPDWGVLVLAARRGAGCTALARKVAEQRADQFPGGAVLLDLDRFRSPEGELTRDAQRYFLSTCGLPYKEHAEAPAELESQFHTAYARRRMLLIVRGVRGAEELRPFEPRRTDQLVLAVTDHLGDDLRRYPHLQLEGLDGEGARQLLADQCGDELIDREPGATADLLQICENFPDAVIQSGTYLSQAQYGPEPVRGLVRQLHDHGAATALGALNHTIDAALARLDDDVAAAAVAMAWHPGFDVDTSSLSAVLGTDGGPMLTALNEAGLLVRNPYPEAPWRCRLQHAVRDRLLRTTTEPDALLHRLLDFLRDCAVHADLEDSATRLRTYPAGHGRRPQPRSDGLGQDLLAYLNSQRAVLLAVVREAYHRGYHDEVCQLGGALEVMINKYGGYDWALAWGEFVIGSAEALVHAAAGDDRVAMAVRAESVQGRMCALLGMARPAQRHLDAAERLVAGLPADTWPSLRASLSEFRGRYHEIFGNPGAAITCFRTAATIDQQTGDDRALLIHGRQLAGVLVDCDDLTGAASWLDEAVHAAGRMPQQHPRNNARVHMVQARAQARAGHAGPAHHCLEQARGILERDGAQHYDWEFREVEVRIAALTESKRRARQRWSDLAGAAVVVNHARANHYLQEYLALS